MQILFFSMNFEYSLGKEFTVFPKEIKYIIDFETYIKVKENNKEDFSEKYLKSKMPKKHTLVLGKDLDLKSGKSIEKERVGERKNKIEVKEI